MNSYMCTQHLFHEFTLVQIHVGLKSVTHHACFSRSYNFDRTVCRISSSRPARPRFTRRVNPRKDRASRRVVGLFHLPSLTFCLEIEIQNRCVLETRRHTRSPAAAKEYARSARTSLFLHTSQIMVGV